MLSISRPAPTNSASDNATSAVIRTARARVFTCPPLVPRDSSLRAAACAAIALRQAGHMANSRTVVTVTANDTQTAVKSTAGVAWLGIMAGASDSKAGTAPPARTTPSRPPASAITAASASPKPINRARLAPSAALTASSCSRWLPRASNKLARFAHAISNTIADAPSMINSGSRTEPFNNWGNGVIRAPRPPFSPGYSSDSRALTVARAASSWATSAPGTRRPIANKKFDPRVMDIGSDPTGM